MENATIIDNEGQNIEQRVVILERDVKSLKKADAVILSKIEKLQEDSSAANAKVLAAIGEVSTEQESQGKKLGFVRGALYSVMVAGGGGSTAAVATDGEKILDFLIHIVEYF